ncbi:hypothetical protein H696_02877 [Fonticula alba]|uniref:Uncharacterized protein n=1 Tax=Fonticula alba TaxID=691883 RepID=A0A058Z8X4_FONAL|nr:hypothetical protein H696_02877 [Fonticula alba]KCV70531.1 hypothetical protein H696_02877 [Fonticula alba]|eukprot:XP_009495047.1 hypothetical protein H696_02877 [Fonticula alba]
MTIIIYVSSISASLDIKKKQSHIESILSSKKIPFETRDIASNEDYKKQMRRGSGGNTIPPQIFKGEEYLGDYDAFENAVECEILSEFLRL